MSPGGPLHHPHPLEQHPGGQGRDHDWDWEGRAAHQLWECCLTLHRPEAGELVAPIKSGAEFLCLPRADGK